MKESLVNDVARKFAPTYVASSGEKCYLVELEHEEKPRLLRAYPSWKPFVYFSVMKLNPQEDVAAYEINYLTIWDWDTGGVLGMRLSGHQWDTERTAILITGPKDEEDVEAFSAQQAYYAAHEGVSLVDRSCYRECESETCGVTVYWSYGKHASYPDNPQSVLGFERFKSPGFRVGPEEYSLVNVGNLEHPSPEAPWICYRKGWGSQKITPIYKKLRTRVWTRKTLRQIKKGSITEEHVRRFQELEHLPVTGEVDRATFEAAQNVDRHLIQNITEFSQGTYKTLHQSEMRGRDIDLVAESNVSQRKIEKIVEKGLRGAKLKKYLAE
jgi:hypothetical protein